MINIGSTAFWLGVSIAYLVLSIAVFTTWWHLRTLHKNIENPTYLTTNGLHTAGIGLGNTRDDDIKINVEKMFWKLVTANLLALVFSAAGAIFTFIQL